MTPRPPCPGCGKSENLGTAPLCSLCWQQVPGRFRTAVLKAQKALGYNPASARVREDLEYAIADACGAIR